MTFSPEDIPSLQGKVAIVTGANTGIGRISAEEMAKKGCHVIMACRSEERTRPVVEEITAELAKGGAGAVEGGKVEFMELDLSSLHSVRRFAEAFKATGLPLHVLLNNAGVMMCPYGLTKDGIETQFGTNHIGHFYLTLLLLDVLDRSQPSRIVCLSSAAHAFSYSEGVRLDKINDEASYNQYYAYGQSKLSNLLFSNELARRTASKRIYVNGVHPGYVATELQRHVQGQGFFMNLLGRLGYSLFAMTPQKGALTQLYAATHPDIEANNVRGRYFAPIAKDTNPKAWAKDEELAKRLWDHSITILKEKLGDLGIPHVEGVDLGI